MNSKWWFRGSSGPVSCSCQTSVGRLRGIGIRLLRAACLGVDGRCSLGRVPRLARLRVFVRAVPQTSLLVFACVCARHLRRRPSVYVTGGSVRVTVCVYELPNLRSGAASHRAALWGCGSPGAPACSVARLSPVCVHVLRERSARSAAPPKNQTHPSPRTRVCAVAVSVRVGGGCPARRPRIAPLRRSRLCAPLCVGTEGAGKCADGRIVRFSGLR